jgi:N utilization substance protein B
MMGDVPRSRRTAREHWRRRAREATLQALYQWDVGKVDIEQAIETVLGRQWPDATPPRGHVREFVSSLAGETVARLEIIDPLIKKAAARWRPERMAIVDRLILRMAVCELIGDSGTPPAIVINEALELARTFSTEDAVKFINGVLDAIRRTLELPKP